MNRSANEILQAYAEKYSEYAEELGASYAQFLLNIMAHDLAETQNHNEYLKKVGTYYARN
jgi:ABC-type sulfate transport system permease component